MSIEPIVSVQAVSKPPLAELIDSAVWAAERAKDALSDLDGELAALIDAKDVPEPVTEAVEGFQTVMMFYFGDIERGIQALNDAGDDSASTD